MGLSSRDRSGAQGTSGFFEAEVGADDDLGLFVCVDPEGWPSADLLVEVEVDFLLSASFKIGKASSASAAVTLA